MVVHVADDLLLYRMQGTVSRGQFPRWYIKRRVRDGEQEWPVLRKGLLADYVDLVSAEPLVRSSFPGTLSSQPL